MNITVFLKGLVFLLSLVGAAYLLLQGMDKTWIDTHVRAHGVTGGLIFIALGAGLAAIGFPRQILAFLGGYAFGVIKGTMMCVLAVSIGCVLTFSYARLLGRGVVQRKFPRKIKRIDAFLSDSPFVMTLLIRLLPVGNNMVTNAAAGVTRVRPVPFVLGSLIGYIPQSLVFALAGRGVDLNPQWNLAVSAVLFIVSGSLGVYLYRRYRHGKTLGRDIERQLSGDETEAESIVMQSDLKSQWPNQLK